MFGMNCWGGESSQRNRYDARDVAVDRDVMQEVLQVDVVLFTCVEDLLAFMKIHPELSKYAKICNASHVHSSLVCSYPSSMFRIIVSCQGVSTQGPLLNFLEFIDSDAQWRFKHPATLAIVAEEYDAIGLRLRPNLQVLSFSQDFCVMPHYFRRSLLDSFISFNNLRLDQALLKNHDRFSSLLPPIEVFEAAADDRSHLMKKFFDSKQYLDLSGLLLRRDSAAVAQWLPFFSALSRLNLSNIEFGDDGIAAILSALTGTCDSCCC